MSFSFAEWYKLNSTRLNQKRKERYHNDPNYRSKVLEGNQRSRLKRQETEVVPKPPREKKVTERFKKVTGIIDGKEVPLYTIGALAEALGCSIQAIRLWERDGIIPPTPIRKNGEHGDRLYTEDMLQTIRTLLERQGRLGSLGRSREKETIRSVRRFVRYGSKRVEETQLFLIGALAEAAQRNVMTLEQLEGKGFLPETPFRTSSVGRRLYTAAMIQAVKDAFDKRGGEVRGEQEWKEFHDEVYGAWKAQGVIDAKLIERVSKKDSNGQSQASG